MDKRMMQFKLLSYKQARDKAIEVGDRAAINSWNKEIKILEYEIDKSI